MKVTVLGCWGGSPRAGGACSGYLVQEGSTNLLLDCGSGVASAAQRLCSLADINHVFVSHYHFDHVSDAGALMFARLVQRQVGQAAGDITFYALAHEPEDAHSMLGISRLALEGASRVVAVDEGGAVRVGPLTLTFLRTEHPVPCLAVRVEGSDGATLVYTADAALSEPLVRFCAGPDVLISECSLYAGVDGASMGHMSCEDVVELAWQARPSTLILSHLPIYGDVRELLRFVQRNLAVRASTRDTSCVPTAELASPSSVLPRVLLASEPLPGQDMLSVAASRRKDVCP